MAERTEAEWRAIDAELAQEVMGFQQRDEYKSGTLFWVSADGEEYVVNGQESDHYLDWDVWRPHADIAQAMEVVDKIKDQGWEFSLRELSQRKGFDARFTSDLTGIAHGCEGRPGTREGTICLAAEKWLDAREEGT